MSLSAIRLLQGPSSHLKLGLELGHLRLRLLLLPGPGRLQLGDLEEEGLPLLLQHASIGPTDNGQEASPEGW